MLGCLAHKKKIWVFQPNYKLNNEGVVVPFGWNAKTRKRTRFFFPSQGFQGASSGDERDGAPMSMAKDRNNNH